MRNALPPLGALALVSVVALAGCAIPDADGSKAEEPAPVVDLTFSYEADGGEGFIDQTLAIANNGGAAGAPDLDIVALDDAGEPLPGVEVVTAFGSDTGQQVVPAYTEVIEVLKFKGPGSDDVADVEVTVTDPGTLDEDVPPANDIKLKRFDAQGKSKTQNTLGSVLIQNTYDAPITVKVVGFELATVDPGEPQHFKQASELTGPITLQPGEKVRERVADKYRSRFFNLVRAYLVR